MVLFSAPDAAIGEIVYFTTAIEVINLEDMKMDQHIRGGIYVI